MNRIKILAVSTLLLFLGAAGVSSAAKSRSSVSPTFPINQPGKSANSSSCDIPSTGTVVWKEVEVDVPDERPGFTFDNINGVPGGAAKQPVPEQPYGLLQNLSGGGKDRWEEYKKFIRSIPREGTSSQIRRYKSGLSSRTRKMNDLLRTINQNGLNYNRDWMTWGRKEDERKAKVAYNINGKAAVDKANAAVAEVWDSYWREGRPIWREAERANSALRRLAGELGRAQEDRIILREENCEDTQEIETDRDDDLLRTWTRGSNEYRVLATRTTNEIKSIERQRDTAVSLEEVTAEEDVENTNAEADAEIIQVVEQYEGEKIDQTNSTNDDIVALTLDAADEERAERDAAQGEIQDVTRATNEEISIIQSDANDQIADINADASGRKSDVRIEFRDSRSGLGDGLQSSLDRVRARWSPRIESLRNRIEEAEKVLRKRPGANWSARLRRQLLQAQRKAERVFNNSKQAVRVSKAKRDAQLAAARRNYNRKIAKSKKAEAARIAQIDRDAAQEIAPIEDGIERQVRSLRAEQAEEERVIRERAEENIEIIKNRRTAQVATLTKTLSELLLRLDRQKSNEAGAIDKQRDLAVRQRERAKVRLITEIKSDAEAEKEDTLALFDEEASTLTSQVDDEMRDIRKTASKDLKSLARDFRGALADANRNVDDLVEAMDEVRGDFEDDYIETEDEWLDESKDVESEGEDKIADVENIYDNAMKDATDDWKKKGSKMRELESRRTKIARTNKSTLAKESRNGKKKVNAIKKEERERSRGSSYSGGANP